MLHTRLSVILQDNVLISDNGTACLSDFGLSLALDKLAIATHGTSLRDVGATRWMAPERFEVSSSGVSMKADIYSFAMVGIEVKFDILLGLIAVTSINIIRSIRVASPSTSAMISMTSAWQSSSSRG